jgi:hydrogenase-4 component E
LDQSHVTSLVDQVALALLAVVLLQTVTYRLATTIGIVVIQGILLTAVALLVAIGTGAPEVYAGALLTAIVRVILVPLLLSSALGRVRVKAENAPVVPARVALVGAIGLTLVAYQVAGAFPLPGGLPSRQALPVALALMLVGMLLMIVRRKALSQVIALVTIENGIALAALVATAGMPIAVELGLAFDLLIGVALMGIFAGWISQTFDTTNVDQLTRLRDR